MWPEPGKMEAGHRLGCERVERRCVDLERSSGKGVPTEGPATATAEGRACNGHHDIHSGRNSGWDDGVAREAGV